MAKAKPQNLILYRGPSAIDGAPIIVVATGYAKKSGNPKTGAVIQTWILREDIAPQEAAKLGLDASICGACPMRPVVTKGTKERKCYVRLHQAPLSVWSSFHRGIYADATTVDALTAAGAGRRVRLGSYGDPAAVPTAVWEAFTRLADAWLGYSHQWRTAAPELARLCMASADSEADALDAKASGWRSFRVRDAFEPKLDGEVVCPASAEAGHKTSCEACGACMGTAAKARASIVIMDHGPSARTRRRFALTVNGGAA